MTGLRFGFIFMLSVILVNAIRMADGEGSFGRLLFNMVLITGASAAAAWFWNDIEGGKA